MDRHGECENVTDIAVSVLFGKPDTSMPPVAYAIAHFFRI